MAVKLSGSATMEAVKNTAPMIRHLYVAMNKESWIDVEKDKEQQRNGQCGWCGYEVWDRRFKYCPNCKYSLVNEVK
jgi:predicted Zn-ribbon and HTH transcriptional regulator